MPGCVQLPSYQNSSMSLSTSKTRHLAKQHTPAATPMQYKRSGPRAPGAAASQSPIHTAVLAFFATVLITKLRHISSEVGPRQRSSGMILLSCGWPVRQRDWTQARARRLVHIMSIPSYQHHPLPATLHSSFLTIAICQYAINAPISYSCCYHFYSYSCCCICVTSPWMVAAMAAPSTAASTTLGGAAESAPATLRKASCGGRWGRRYIIT